MAYAKAQYGEVVTLYGVMTLTGGAQPPNEVVAEMLGAVAPITAQSDITWVSSITA